MVIADACSGHGLSWGHGYKTTGNVFVSILLVYDLPPLDLCLITFSAY